MITTPREYPNRAGTEGPQESPQPRRSGAPVLGGARSEPSGEVRAAEAQRPLDIHSCGADLGIDKTRWERGVHSDGQVPSSSGRWCQVQRALMFDRSLEQAAKTDEGCWLSVIEDRRSSVGSTCV